MVPRKQQDTVYARSVRKTAVLWQSFQVGVQRAIQLKGVGYDHHDYRVLHGFHLPHELRGFLQ